MTNGPLPQALQEKVQRIATDREHGAAELARQSLAILADAARRHPAADRASLLVLLDDLAKALMAARPSMAPLQNLPAAWQEQVNRIDETDLTALREQAAKQAEQLIDASHRAVASIAQHAAHLIAPGQTVMTHSLSSTVAATFEQLQAQHVQAIVTESRPLCEGYDLAKKLAGWSIPTTLITDAQIGVFVPQADVVLIGADSLLPDGSVVNKVGSYPLSLAAQAHHVPVYVCCERFKQRRGEMPSLELEEKDPAELDAPTFPYVTVKNIYFEVTPARLITGWIDELGAHSEAQ